jgi:sensor domain CHASE-containing protein
MKLSGMTKKYVQLLCGLGVLLLLAFATMAQSRRENSEELIQQITQELRSAREQLSRMDTDSGGHKYKLEQLLDQSEREARELAASLPRRR